MTCYLLFLFVIHKIYVRLGGSPPDLHRSTSRRPGRHRFSVQGSKKHSETDQSNLSGKNPQRLSDDQGRQKWGSTMYISADNPIGNQRVRTVFSVNDALYLDTQGMIMDHLLLTYRVSCEDIMTAVVKKPWSDKLGNKKITVKAFEKDQVSGVWWDLRKEWELLQKREVNGIFVLRNVQISHLNRTQCWFKFKKSWKTRRAIESAISYV